MLRVDLHVHSNRSDGTYSPKELVDYAIEKGLAAFALTDHDTVDGLDEAISYAEKLRQERRTLHGASSANIAEQVPSVPEVIPGIEFSTEYQGQDVHIVGLYIDYHNRSFREQLQEFVDSRINRNHKMCRLLQEAGIQISYEALQEEFPDAVITRAHYAKYMLNHGYIKSIPEAFARYVGDHCPCYVPREKVTPVQAVKLVLDAGGIPVLAHPILYHMSDSRLDELTAELKGVGLMGIEAIYSTYKPHEERQIRALAKKYDLRISGGSDFHGSNKPGLDLGTGYGALFVPMDVLTDLKKLRHA
ncbi:MAG: PHP domain-containing protein [Acetatifactor sp.]|nr:PHP domain-containing protein [Acetatifactor sp.]